MTSQPPRRTPSRPDALGIRSASANRWASFSRKVAGSSGSGTSKPAGTLSGTMRWPQPIRSFARMISSWPSAATLEPGSRRSTTILRFGEVKRWCELWSVASQRRGDLTLLSVLSAAIWLVWKSCSSSNVANDDDDFISWGKNWSSCRSTHTGRIRLFSSSTLPAWTRFLGNSRASGCASGCASICMLPLIPWRAGRAGRSDEGCGC
mmetsp:Transcript_14202/g.40528  ORF Transcript_14202/g.40528 Transcript_14202/m.40528 type:complete len:207 (-) Transcript_14202:5998-6618(-)